MCTIAEVLDWNGVWTRELVELMLPVAWEREIATKRTMFEAQIAACGSLFSKDAAKTFIEAMQKEQDGVRRLQRISRGEDSKPKGNERAAKAARDLADGFAKAGFGVKRGGKKR